MPDNIEQSADGTQAAFVSLREPAWHRLGTIISKPVSTLKMLALGHLADWNVREADISVPSEPDSRFVIPARAVVRTNPFDQGTDVLGIVGHKYHIVQNEEAFSFADNLLNDGRWETAGSIKDGRVVFGSLALDREVVLDEHGANDVVNSYLLIMTSHDGSTGVTAAVTPVRVVCQNTLNIALSGTKQSFKIRHTQAVSGKVAAAKQALGLAHTYLDKFEAEAQAMIQAEITKADFEKIVLGLFPKPETTPAATTRHEAKVEALLASFTGSTQENIAGTKWAAFNALTEVNQWERNVRDGNEENFYAAGAGFDLVTNAFRQKALVAVKAFA